MARKVKTHAVSCQDCLKIAVLTDSADHAVWLAVEAGFELDGESILCPACFFLRIKPVDYQPLVEIQIEETDGIAS